MQVNLLPAEFKNHLIFRNRVRLWIRLWSMCGVLAFGLCLLGYVHLVQIRGSFASLQTESRSWSEKHRQIHSLDSDISKLAAEKSYSLQATSSAPLGQWLAKIQQATASSPSGIQVTGLRMQLPGPPRDPQAGPAIGPDHASPIQLEAQIGSQQSLADFFARLQSQGSFQIRNLQMQEQTDQTTRLTLELSQP